MANKIDSKITGYKVKTGETEKPIVLTSLPEREEVLDGITIKIKPPLSESAYYITVNFQTIEGIKRPFEVFIRTKNIDNQELILTQAIMYSSIFRKGGDYQFILDEMKLIHDPRGSYRGKIGKDRYTFNSLTAHIAIAVEEVIKSTK
jgi:hypothetical protein